MVTSSSREARLHSRPRMSAEQQAAWEAATTERDGDMPLEARRRFLRMLGDLATPEQWETYWNLELAAQSKRYGHRMTSIVQSISHWDAYYAELDAELDAAVSL